jgi:hypothetical protein
VEQSQVSGHSDPNLAKVIEAWPTLPTAVRASFLAKVREVQVETSAVGAGVMTQDCLGRGTANTQYTGRPTYLQIHHFVYVRRVNGSNHIDNHYA